MLKETMQAVKDAEKKADDMLVEAREKGEALVETAKEESKALKQRGLDEAKQIGADAMQAVKKDEESIMKDSLSEAEAEIEKIKQVAKDKEADAIDLIKAQLV